MASLNRNTLRKAERRPVHRRDARAATTAGNRRAERIASVDEDLLVFLEPVPILFVENDITDIGGQPFTDRGSAADRPADAGVQRIVGGDALNGSSVVVCSRELPHVADREIVDR
jgi:hypothetical protein